ncbi:MAG: ABC transporter permease, partial [Gemmatimonadales bacterium]|nr:ABC transporter permease [Gemmatimonadales bacterium]
MTADRRGWRDQPLVQLTLTRYREFLREPEALFWVFLFPVLLTAGLGLAFRNQKPQPTPIAVVGGRDASAQLATGLAAAPGVTVRQLDDSAAALALRTGRVALVVIPDGGGSVRYRYDEERPDSRLARLQVDAAIQQGGGAARPVGVREERVREVGARYVDFVVPGLLGMNLMGSGIWGLGFAIVDARRKRLLKRLVATPMSRTQYLLSFLLSRLTMLVVEVTLLLGFATLVFGVPIRGAIGTLALVCVLSSLAFGALGLLIASRASTTEGVSGLMNLVMLPMWIFSG